MDLERFSAKEQERIADLVRLMPRGRQSALEIGARGGYFTELLLERFSQVSALDLEKPDISIPGITPVKGDVAALRFPDESFDVVVCTEVEHTPPGQPGTGLLGDTEGGPP
ncbi:MAG: class I SAM-dependent methyltransferase [Proteobacteria bacterium]|nr:class I SAM-dependent methyltransferase [Pseudomonadota bacterium]MBU1449369.1 class I SAM-dependent methyltransferase [Pseudomonadota bacterium]MBU2469143.1 class I SAM-dependent methyltransferase [Pseudomonadota bacterium]MBU2517040.1 class I SAM-dependent methyltransferase [Pseudomonadota bacterium]